MAQEKKKYFFLCCGIIAEKPLQFFYSTTCYVLWNIMGFFLRVIYYLPLLLQQIVTKHFAAFWHLHKAVTYEYANETAPELATIQASHTITVLAALGAMIPSLTRNI